MIASSFYKLNSPDSQLKRASWADKPLRLDGATCPIHPSHGRASKRLGNLSVTLPHGAVEDFVWTWYSECLIQEQVLSLFRDSGVTGFDVRPVKTGFDRDSNEKPPILWELVVTGWAGIASPESGIERIEFCPGCLKTKYSELLRPECLIDENRWDRSDLFMVWPMPKFIFATERVVDLIRQHDLTGIQAIPVSEIKSRMPHFPPPTNAEEAEIRRSISGFSPGRLSDWMPEDLARKRGEAAGIEEI